MAGHCTGVVPMFSLKEDLDLTRQSAVIGAVRALLPSRRHFCHGHRALTTANSYSGRLSFGRKGPIARLQGSGAR